MSMARAAQVTALALAAALSACSTTPATTGVTPVPADRLLAAAKAAPVPGGGSIRVTRDSGLMGAACSTRVWIDGEPVADLRPSERVVVHVPSGERIVSAQPNAICAGGLVEVQANVRSGRESRFRVGAGHNGEVILAPTAF